MHTLLTSFLFGFTLAVAIGPIALLILRAGLEQGLGTALRCAFGAASADLLFALIAFLAGAAALARLEAYRELIELTGAVALLALGVWLAVTAWRHGSGAGARLPPAVPFGFRSTLALTLVNPLTIVLFVSFASQLDSGMRGALLIGAALAVFAGSLVVQLVLAGAGAFLHRSIRSPRTLRALNLVSGLGIAAFGVRGLVAG